MFSSFQFLKHTASRSSCHATVCIQVAICRALRALSGELRSRLIMSAGHKKMHSTTRATNNLWNTTGLFTNQFNSTIETILARACQGMQNRNCKWIVSVISFDLFYVVFILNDFDRFGIYTAAASEEAFKSSLFTFDCFGPRWSDKVLSQVEKRVCGLDDLDEDRQRRF